MKKILFSVLLLFLLFLPARAYADVHNRPSTTISYSPSPTTPGVGFSYYPNPVVVNLQSSADAGYTVTYMYYKLDGGGQQTYSAPLTVSGSGTHGIEYWSVDDSGLEEYPHKTNSFIISPQNGSVNSIAQNTQNNNLIDVSAKFDNFAAYTSQFYSSDCYNDNGASFQLYDATTGVLISSQSGYSHCGSLGNGNYWLGFPPVQLSSGTYFIHYHGGDNEDWITSSYAYVAPVPHNKPVTNSSLSPPPSTLATNLIVYQNPVTVSLQAIADVGYNISTTFYKIDGGSQQTYSAPFTVSGSGTHGIEYWSIDNTGLEESPHKTRSFTITPQSGLINSIAQNSTTIDVSAKFDNFAAYTSQFYSSDCYNDNGASFQLYNATTGAIVSSQSGYSHCGSLGNGNSWLGFPPLQLVSGNYFIHYHGGDNSEWITSSFTYTAPAPVHNKPNTNSVLSPTPNTLGSGLPIYSNPVTVVLSASADLGYSITNTFYKIDGGSQQTYSAPFTVSGSGTHGIEYWSIDNTGLEESPHKTNTFIISPQHGVITSLMQGGITIDVSTHFDNFDSYMIPFYSSDCYNDNGASFQLYNATTGAIVSSQSGYSHCGKLANGDNWLGFPPLQIPAGTYFIHYHGGDNEDWITDNYIYTGNHAPSMGSISNATVNEGDTYSTSGLFTDSDSSSWVGTVNYGDGTGAQSLSLDPDKTFSLNHTYKDNGVYTVTVSITDNQGLSDTKNAIVTVNNVVPTVGAIDAPIVPISTNTSMDVQVNFTDPGVYDTHTAVWDWGDNSTSPGVVTELNGSGSVSNSHTYATAGVYTVKVTVTDKDNGSSVSTTTVLVNTAPTADSGGPYSVNEGSTVALLGTGSDPDSGDTLSYSWDLDNNGSFETSGQNVTYPAADGPGVKTVALRVCDNHGACSISNGTVNILNVNPTVGSVTVTASTVLINNSITVSANFTDPGILDTHTASISWGDGNITSGTVTGLNGSGSVTGSHSYTTVGVYTVAVTVTDKDGGQGSSQYQYVAVYDPTAGFMTGAGRFNSPTPSGNVIFGISAKYTGTNTPTGQSRINFPTANITLDSTSYDWLVVSGAKATLKGTGTVNGVSGYTFLISGIDGSQTGGQNYIRVRITDASNNVIYDTQPNDPDTVDPITPTSSGSIKVH